MVWSRWATRLYNWDLAPLALALNEGCLRWGGEGRERRGERVVEVRVCLHVCVRCLGSGLQLCTEAQEAIDWRSSIAQAF